MAKHIAEQFNMPWWVPPDKAPMRCFGREPDDRAFFFHFNKPLSKQRGKPQISVHYKGACHIVDNITCSVPTRGRINKRQPYFVITGKGKLTVDKGIAYIT